MLDWYNDYYRSIRTSRANARFCERVYGRDLGQHGFMDEQQLRALLDALALGPGELALDLGCGDGRIAELLSDETGSDLVGVDNSRPAIESATIRTRPKRGRLSFSVMDLGQLGFASGVFDSAIAVDSLYFTPLGDTIGEIGRALRPGGRLATFYSYGLTAEVEVDRTLESEWTPLALTLAECGFEFYSRDFTEADYRLMQLRITVLAELEPEFQSEGNLFIYENRIGEAKGISRAIESGRHRRYLYVASRSHGD